MMSMLYSLSVLAAVLMSVCDVTSGRAETTQELPYEVHEQEDVGHVVGYLAQDASGLLNISSNQDIKYVFLSENDPTARLFSIGARSGVLTTDTVIDREYVCEFMSECILKIDVAVYLKNANSDSYELSFVIPVAVTVHDVNDNSPEFPSATVNLQVSESTPVDNTVLTSGAFDRDSGVNSQISYHITPSTDRFRLKEIRNLDDSLDLGIVVLQPLDRETDISHNFKIVAVDGGSPTRTGTATINIAVVDVNDNSPVFGNTTYGMSINEDVGVDSAILELHATDADSGDNGRVTYHFETRVPSHIRSAINIDESTGTVSVAKQLDFESVREYKFLVEARDHGPVPKKSRALITINILDVNDNKPVIQVKMPPSGNVVLESLEVGSSIGEVSATDGDSGPNGEVSCEIYNAKFSLRKYYNNLYKIVLQRDLDYETSKSENVTITCRDAGDTPSESSTTFVVYTEDVNDNSPIFEKNMYNIRMAENNNIGDYLVTLSAHDADSNLNGRITYSVSHALPGKISINPADGVILATSVFDRETTPEIRFEVIASDSGSEHLSSTATVVIELTDVNDNPPTFDRSEYVFHISEYATNGSLVGRLEVSDPDEEKNGEFDISLSAEHDFFTNFALNLHSGEVTTTNKLNRELMPEDGIKFSVVAMDRGDPSRTSSVSAVILIDDENDNIPIILFPHNRNHTVRVPHDSVVGSYITKVLALDKDTGNNAKLTYAITEGNDLGLFIIEAESGAIRLANSFGSVKEREHELLISVTDKGDKPLTSYANLNIHVYKNNQTALGSTPSTDSLSSNVVIVIVLILATIVISTGILATICIVRRADRLRKYDDTKGINGSNNGDFEIGDVHPANAEELQKKKKCVKFTIADDTTKGDNQIRENEVNPEYDTYCKLKQIEKHAEKIAKAEHLARYINDMEDSGSNTSADSGRGVSEGGSQEEIKHVHVVNGSRQRKHDPDIQSGFLYKQYEGDSDLNCSQEASHPHGGARHKLQLHDDPVMHEKMLIIRNSIRGSMLRSPDFQLRDSKSPPDYRQKHMSSGSSDNDSRTTVVFKEHDPTMSGDITV